MYGNKQGLTFNIRNTLTVMNSNDNGWGAEVRTITQFHTSGAARNTPLVFRITFNIVTGFGIEFENNQIATLPNRLNVPNANLLTVNTAFDNTGTITVTEASNAYLYKVENAQGIREGSYNNIPLTTFGFGLANKPNYWTIQIKFTANILGRYQGLLGNAYNNDLPTFDSGWGFWISTEGYFHFRIQNWNENFSSLGTITINTPHTLVIHFVNDTYIIGLTNNSTNVTKTISVTGQSRLISNRGSICLGGKWILNPTSEVFDGNITLVEFSTTQTQMFLQLDSNNVTIKYTGNAADVPTSSALFIQANPRGTGLEWFAVVKDSMISAITVYANGSNGSFIPPGQSVVPFNNIVTTLVTNTISLFENVGTFNESIGSWDTSSVTNMNSMFVNASNFNQPIGSWNTANVTSMASMFYNVKIFNQDIGGWNTAKVTNMNSMFANASKFNQPIGSWNTANVTGMHRMFYDVTFFNQPIGSWNTANVTDMSHMFNYTAHFNQPIGSWNTAKVMTMYYMFSNCQFNQPINHNTVTNSWNTANVTNMAAMFMSSTLFNQDIGSWNTANVTDMASMFNGATTFDKEIGQWTTGKVRSMWFMFSDATNFSKPIGSWDTSNVTSMYGMFNNASRFNQSINFNTANVTDMSYMFNGATAFNQSLNLNTFNCRNMRGMFTGATVFNSTVSLNVSSVTDMSGMFMSAANFNQSLVSLFASTSNVTDMSYMFNGAVAFNSALSEYHQPCYTQNVTNMNYMFTNAYVFNQRLNFITNKVIYMDGMFSGARRFNQNLKPYFANTVLVWELPNLISASQFNIYAQPIQISYRPTKTYFFDSIQFTDINNNVSFF